MASIHEICRRRRPKSLSDLFRWSLNRRSIYGTQEVKSNDNNIAIVNIIGGTMSKENVIAELKRMIPINHDWIVNGNGDNSFLVQSPNRNELLRYLSVEDISCKGFGTIMRFSEWTAESAVKFNLHKVWVRIFGLPLYVHNYNCICAASSTIGATLVVDMVTTKKTGIPRVQVGVIDSSLILPAVDMVIGTCGYELTFVIEAIDNNEEDMLFESEENKGGDNQSMKSNDTDMMDQNQKRVKGTEDQSEKGAAGTSASGEHLSAPEQKSGPQSESETVSVSADVPLENPFNVLQVEDAFVAETGYESRNTGHENLAAEGTDSEVSSELVHNSPASDTCKGGSHPGIVLKRPDDTHWTAQDQPSPQPAAAVPRSNHTQFFNDGNASKTEDPSDNLVNVLHVEDHLSSETGHEAIHTGHVDLASVPPFDQLLRTDAASGQAVGPDSMESPEQVQLSPTSDLGMEGSHTRFEPSRPDVTPAVPDQNATMHSSMCLSC